MSAGQTILFAMALEPVPKQPLKAVLSLQVASSLLLTAPEDAFNIVFERGVGIRHIVATLRKVCDDMEALENRRHPPEAEPGNQARIH